MAALFHKFSSDQIFKNSVGNGTLAICSALDQFNSDPSNVSIITDVSVRATDTIQFFQSFDDLIHYYYFGKGLGNISFNMMLFQSCGGADAPGVPKLLAALGQMRGQETQVSVGNIVFVGVLTDFTLSIQSEPETHYIVNINLGMIDHQLSSPPPADTSC